MIIFIDDGASTPASPFLDSYTTGVTFAYARKRLFTSYTGYLYRVRRSSDNTELDIGYDATTLLEDTSALTAFVGANDGFVTKWYDQSGAALDPLNATTTKQPKIVSTGTVLTTIQWDGVDDFLQTAGNHSSTSVGMTMYYSGTPAATTGSGTPVPFMIGGTNTAIMSYAPTLTKIQPIATGNGAYSDDGQTDDCRCWQVNLSGGATFQLQNLLRRSGATTTFVSQTNNAPSPSPIGGGKITIGDSTAGGNVCRPRLRAFVGYNAVHSTATIDAINAILAS